MTGDGMNVNRGVSGRTEISHSGSGDVVARLEGALDKDVTASRSAQIRSPLAHVIHSERPRYRRERGYDAASGRS